jgi:hypothetical protein
MYTLESLKRAMDKRKFRRHLWFAENGPCSCGSWEDLQVHHIDPSTKVDHKVWSWSEARRYAELSKCVPKCRPCHKQITEDSLRVGHGHIATYKRGCRCEPCRAVKKLENAKRIRHPPSFTGQLAQR